MEKFVEKFLTLREKGSYIVEAKKDFIKSFEKQNEGDMDGLDPYFKLIDNILKRNKLDNLKVFKSNNHSLVILNDEKIIEEPFFSASLQIDFDSREVVSARSIEDVIWVDIEACEMLFDLDLEDSEFEWILSLIDLIFSKQKIKWLESKIN